MTRQRSANRRRRGSVLVESSLILIVFFVVLIGTFDVSQLLFVQHSLTERTRNAARYGAVNTFDQTAIENMVLYNQPAIPDGATPAFNLTRAMLAVSRQDAGTPEDRVVVTVAWYPIQFFTPWIAGTTTGVPITTCASYEGF